MGAEFMGILQGVNAGIQAVNGINSVMGGGPQMPAQMPDTPPAPQIQPPPPVAGQLMAANRAAAAARQRGPAAGRQSISQMMGY